MLTCVYGCNDFKLYQIIEDNGSELQKDLPFLELIGILSTIFDLLLINNDTFSYITTDHITKVSWITVVSQRNTIKRE